MVESIDSARGYAERLREIFTDAITLVDGESLRDLKTEVLSDG